jgi:segregation and condensation protein A
MTPLGELSIRWTGTEDAEIEINDEFDGAPPDEPAPVDEPEETPDDEEQA